MPVILACCYRQENPGLESEESCFVSVIFVFAAIAVISFLLLFKNTVAHNIRTCYPPKFFLIISLSPL